MGAELGATTSIFPYDDRMAKYLAATAKGELARLADQHRYLLVADEEVEAHPERHFDRIVELDLSDLEPHIVGPSLPGPGPGLYPSSPLRSRDHSNRFVDDISAALIGSCTNSSYEDMGRAADVAEQAVAHGLKAAVPFMVTPGSELIRATIERDGQMASLKKIDGTVLANACGPCIGQWQRAKAMVGVPNTIITSYNRNFPRRNDGQPSTMNFIGSPEIVTAFALAGKLAFNPMTDSLTGADGKPFKLRPPERVPEVPAKNFDRGNPHYVPPPEDGSSIELQIDPNSERLQVLKPWPAWDGNDFKDLRVLVKAQGKCTTDHISPAGPWLRYRGHLDKFSDNMFMGATNAFASEAGKGLNVLTGERGQALSQIARHYKAQGVKWVVIGDSNYGEGSSREHAALSPRLLGGAAVIVRSFARIHESNLKKQGLLPLAFEDPADYDRILDDDRISLLGLKDLGPGKPVRCVLKHADGTEAIINLRHTLNGGQIAWFKAGSAMNHIKNLDREGRS